MAGTRTLKLKVLGDAKGAVQALGLVNVGMSSITKGIAVAGAAIAGSAAAVGAFAYKAVQAASNLEETQSKVNVIFGQGAETVREFAKTAAGSLGQSKQTAMDAAATFGIFGKSAGLAGAELAEFSTDFVKLSADLASFNNTTPEMAIQAIGAALRGESEPLRRYGVLLNDAALRQEAMALGIYNGSGALTSQQKILAAQSAIYKQTGDAQGDFNRTSDGLANQQRILKASIENLTTTIGTVLLPYFTKIIQTINKYLTPAVTAFAEELGNGGSLDKAIIAAIASMGDFGLTFVDTLEQVTLAVLNFLKQFSDIGRTIALTVSLVGALTGNVALTLKATAASLAFKKAQQGINSALVSTPALFDRVRQSVINASAAQVKTIPAILGSADALERAAVAAGVKAKADEDLVITTGGATKAVETAQEKLTKYIDAVKGVTQAQRGLREANKSVLESNENLTQKTKALMEAQRKFALVTKGYGKESKEAKNAEQERAKAERTSERAKYALEEALFAVKDAELALADARKDPESTPQAIREAEIRLAQAKLSVADAVDQQRESTEALELAQHKLNETVNGAEEGSKTYQSALDELLEAEKAQTEAIDARTQAYERLRDATDDLREAEEKRIAAGKGVPANKRAEVDANEPVVVPDLPSERGTGFDFGFGEVLLDELKNIRIPTLEEMLGIGFGVPMAKGGIVTRATSIVAGERGAEAIIPLNRIGGLGNTYNIEVNAGMGANGKDIGTEIVNALKRYERTNGALPLTVQ